jgi:hypothetical protein
MAKYGKKAQETVHEVMEKFKKGELKSRTRLEHGLKGGDYENDPAHHLDFAADRGPAYLALQCGLGLLSKRRAGVDPSGFAHPGAAGAHLALAPHPA